VCYSKANVKLIGGHTGLAVGPDGATHQALEDIALTRCLPNMTVLVPSDFKETKKATLAAAETKGPVYIRFARNDTPVFTTKDTPFKIGQAEVYTAGNDVSIVACGPLVHEALLAAKELAKEGIQARVINSHTVKPLDEKTMTKAARETGAVVTVEDHSVIGGLGSAVAEVLSKSNPVPIEMIGVQDQFGESGESEELWKKYKLTAPYIIEAVKKVVKRK